jgi:hypothetical protein
MTKKKFESCLQVIICPPDPKKRKVLCGEAKINLFFYIYNFLLTSKSFSTGNKDFRKVVYRQKIKLNRCADPHAQIFIVLTISKRLQNTLKSNPSDMPSSTIDNKSLLSVSNFSNLSWVPKPSQLTPKRFLIFAINNSVAS